MNQNYFHRVTRQTPTRLWINNPSQAEAARAIAEGAVGCTTNPSYSQKMVDHAEDGPAARRLLDEAIRQTSSAEEAALLFQRMLVKPIADQFLPMYQQSNGLVGHVSIQGDPIDDHSLTGILEEARVALQLAPNIAIKIPATIAGLQAMEALMEDGVAINATEIFSIDQALDVCELHRRINQKTGLGSRLYMSHIAGIFDDHVRQQAQEGGIDISSDVLWQSGLAVARKVYRVLEERGYDYVFISGGARGPQHFTEMVGGKVCVTINWVGMVDQLLQSNPPVVYRLFNPVPEQVIAELLEKLPDFRRAYQEGALSREEYETFGPVEFFRNSFIKSWKRVLDLIRERQPALWSRRRTA
jgi:transaldolase